VVVFGYLFKEPDIFDSVFLVPYKEDADNMMVFRGINISYHDESLDFTDCLDGYVTVHAKFLRADDRLKIFYDIKSISKYIVNEGKTDAKRCYTGNSVI
jgi:hypothetical protein